MPEQEETQTEEQAPESTDEASAGDDAPEAEADASAGDDAQEADASAGEEATEAEEASAVTAASGPEPHRDPAIANAIEHLEDVDMEQEREAVDKLSKDLEP